MNFQQKVWKLLEKIPKGKVTTYSLIAKKMKTKAYRAVGTACHNNQTTAPCYRVVRSDGTVGICRHNDNCYKKRIERLRKDGIEIKGNKILDFEKKLFKF